MLKPYGEYKDSSLWWCGNIPSHWKIIKIKRLFKERNEKGYPNEPLLAATQNKGVIPKSLYENRTVIAEKNLHLLKLVRIGDFVISLRSFQGGIEYAYYQGIISPAYTIITPSRDIYSGYFRYLGKSNVFIELLKICVTGIREGQNIDYGKLKNSLIPLPPLEEQNQIVRYLDYKISKINKLINIKKREAELFKELKQALITKAVTKGIDENVKMKDSGVEWIGEIPEEWETKKLKYVAETETKKYSPENGKLNYFALENIVSWESKYIETENEYDLSGSNLCYKDDVVFGKLRPYLAKTFLVDYNRCCSSEFAIFSKYKGIPKYLLYVVTTKNFVFTIDNSTYGIKMPRANIEFINNVIIPNPPISEQQAIADYLDKKCDALDKLVSEKERVIEKLEEYKKSLIYECVTGKKEIINNE